MKKLLLPILFSGIALVSCNKDRIEEEAEFQPMDEFYNEHKAEEQEFIIHSDSGSGPLIGKQLTELYGYRNILQYPNGDTVPFPYSIKLIELYTYKDMILYRMPSLAGTAITETGGEIKVRACHDGNELVLIPGKFYPAVLSTQPTQPNMKVYQGNHPNNEYGDWTLSSDGSTVLDTGKYALALGKLGWQNCAKIGTSGGLGKITLKVEGKGGEFINLFLAMENYHGLVKGNNLEIENAPLGQEATLIAMAMDQNGDFRLHKESITISANQTITLDMKVVSEAALLSELSGL